MSEYVILIVRMNAAHPSHRSVLKTINLLSCTAF